MKRYIVGFLLAAVFLASSAAATGTIKKYKDEKKLGGDQWNLTMIYLDGVGNGFTSANGYLESNQKPLLFCMPRRLALNVQTILDILDRSLAHPNPAFTDNFPIDI